MSLSFRIAARYLLAGGIDVQEDVRPLIPSLAATVSSLKDSDIALLSYTYEYLVGEKPAAKPLFEALATEYAQRFASWLGHVFLNRANMVRTSKDMTQLKEGLAKWVENLPEEVCQVSRDTLGSYIPTGSKRFLDASTLDKLGASVVRGITKDYFSGGTKQARSNLSGLEITYDPKTSLYSIPKSPATFKVRDELKDLGFKFTGDAWTIKTVDSELVKALPQIQKVHKSEPVRRTLDLVDFKPWFFKEWLPSNIGRFTTVFNNYGKGAGIPYDFNFVLSGDKVEVEFKRDVKTVADAVAELTKRYGGSDDRDGWMTAIRAWEQLKSVKGKAAMAAIDMANDLEHSHGSMMEHFPAKVRSWYPRFLDFKYSARPWQLVQRVSDEDFKTVTQELLPVHDRKDRLAPSPTDHRTVRGLALEVSSQKGKAAKVKELQRVRKEYPDMYDDVVKELASRGLKLV